MVSRRAAAALAFVLALAALLWTRAAAAAKYVPPPLVGHVVDSANVLTDAQRLRLDHKLEDARRRTGFAIVVFTLPQLPEGMTIADVGYETGNAWKVGSKGGDDGVILVNTVADRHLRIETGKGVGGALTDIESNHISKQVIAPLVKQGRYYDAYDQGTDAILQALAEGTPGGVSEQGRGPGARAPPQLGMPDYLKIGGIAFVVILVIVLAIVSPTFREILFWVLLFGRFGGGGRGGGGGGDGGSGYGGGGGSFGGGGSSDDY